MTAQIIATVVGILFSAVLTVIITSKVHEQRLTSIEHKLDVHNGYAEKLGDIQKDIAALKTDVEWLKTRWKND